VWMKDETTWVFYDAAYPNGTWEIARMDSISGHISSPGNQDYMLDLAAAEAYRVTHLYGLLSAGVCNIQLLKATQTNPTHAQGSLAGEEVACNTTRSNLTNSTQAPITSVAKNNKLMLRVTDAVGAADLTFGLQIVRSRS